MAFTSEHRLLSIDIENLDVDDENLVVLSMSGVEGLSQLTSVDRSPLR